MIPRLLLSCLLLSLCSCTLIDVRVGDDFSMESDGLVNGYVDYGWPEMDSVLYLGLFEGRSDGSILSVAVWKLVRLEVGLLGFNFGVLPLDFGVGILFFDPRAPRYVSDDDWDEHEHEDDQEDAGHGEHDEDHEDG